jgi:hypothetical protein
MRPLSCARLSIGNVVEFVLEVEDESRISSVESTDGSHKSRMLDVGQYSSGWNVQRIRHQAAIGEDIAD